MNHSNHRLSPLETYLAGRKSVRVAFVLGIVSALAGCSSATAPDSVKQARTTNEQAGAASQVNEETMRFLVEAADARMMDAAEGELAATRATTEDLRAYGRLMVAEQAVLLKMLRETALRVGVVLPTVIGKAKQDGLDDLQKLDGKEFDEKFIKMITIDHKRDVGEFEEASKFSNAAVRQFAADNLPMIERHLSEINAIHAARKAGM